MLRLVRYGQLSHFCRVQFEHYLQFEYNTHTFKHFPFQSKDKELNLAQINQRELDASATSQTLVELQDKVQRLQEELKQKESDLESLTVAASKSQVCCVQKLYVLYWCYVSYNGVGCCKNWS